MGDIGSWLLDRWRGLRRGFAALWGTGAHPALDDGRTIPPDPIAQKPGARAHDHDRCMNCQTKLLGPFCHVCGQRDDDYRRPFVALSNELLSDVFQWDSRILRSVGPFLAMPGTLTRAFMQGRRGVFVSPLRLYFVVSLLFFLTLALANVAILKFEVHGLTSAIDQAVDNGTVSFDGDDVDLDEDDAEDVVEALDALEGVVPPEAQGEIRAARERVADRVAERLDAEEEPEPKPQIKRPFKATVLEGVILGPNPGPEAAINQPKFNSDDINFRVKMFTPLSEDDEPNDQLSDSTIARLLEDADGEGAVYGERALRLVNAILADPRIFNDLLNEWLPRTMVFLVPLFAFVMSILYGRKRGLKRRVYFIDHLVFSLHFHAFIFALMIALVLKGRYIGEVIDGTATAAFFFLATSLYLYVGMKRIYEQGYFKTTVKFIFMMLFLYITYLTSLTGITIYGLWNMVV